MKTINFAALAVTAYTLSAAWTAPTPTQQAYLKASNTGANDNFGSCLAISGDTMVVGAPLEDSNATGINGNQSNNSATDSGAAYVFVRNGTNWVQQAYLKASNTGVNDQFGWWVAVSGDTVVVATPFEGSNASGINGNQSNNSAVNAGAAYIFVRDGTNWSQQAYLKASNTGPNLYFGQGVAVSGDTVVVGATGDDSNASGVNGDQNNNSLAFAGAAYVFVRSGTNWSQQAYLKASNPGAGDNFGASVAVSGDTVVVGAWNEASNATGVNGDQTNNSAPGSGAAYVFVRTGTNWTQQSYLKASNTGAGDEFSGWTGGVAVSGDTIVVGAGQEDSDGVGVKGDQANDRAVDSGAAYIFVRTGTNWTQQAYLKASNAEAGDNFAGQVAISADVVVVEGGDDSNATGINGNQNNNTATDSGAAYVFLRAGTNWTQQAYLKASNAGAHDFFSVSPGVSGGTVVVGAPGEDSNATGVNGNQTNNSATDSGAVYVYTGLGSPATQDFQYNISDGQVSIASYVGPGGDVTIPERIQGLPVTSIGDSAFNGLTTLVSVTIPDSVTSIGGAAFSGCTGLSGITIPKSVTSIGSWAFLGCTGLTNVTIPDSVTRIPSRAFGGCTSLTSVTIPNSVTFIGSFAFSGCTGLSGLTIPKSVTSIGHFALSDCTNLSAVYFKGNTPTILGEVVLFSPSDKAIVYYLPETTGWDSMFGGRPAVLWNPQALPSDPSFGVRKGQFGFPISGISGLIIVVEACADLANPVWTPVGTNTLTGGSSYFGDPQLANHPARFYRLRSP